MAEEHKAKTTRGAQTTHGTVEQPPTPTTEKLQDEQAQIAAKDFAPINPKDDKANPVKVELPKTAQAIADEGTALGQAGAEATGGNVAPVGTEATGTRVWSLDSDQNVNLRQGGPGANQPDVVEFGS